MQARGRDRALGLYPKDRLEGRENYVGRGTAQATMAAFRIGAWERPWENREVGNCYRCGQAAGEVRQHIIVCKSLGEGWEDKGDETNLEKCKRVLGDTSWENQKKLARRAKVWKDGRPPE